MNKIEEINLIDIMCLSYPNNIVKKKVVYIEENKMKIKFETMNYKEANFSPSSFMKKNETFYLYQNVL